MVIFGATGDLMDRKLMPALYHLVGDGEISKNIFIVGVGRRAISTEQFRDLMAASVKKGFPGDVDTALCEHICKQMHYVQGAFEDRELYSKLTHLLEGFDTVIQACVPRFFYLATPPQHYETILTHLGDSKLSEGCLPASAKEQALQGSQGFAQFTRVLIEKPFGKDLDTAIKLDRLLEKTFEERQIYRIDHYLGKETIQNILSLRFANGIFEPTWNAEFIDHVQITLAETVGVGTRGEFYDGVGAIRDVVQNHMLEMLAIIAMDQPWAFDAQSIRDERVKVLQGIQAISPEQLSNTVIRGQYEGYRAEANVDPKSSTESFVALKLMLKNKRWRGVPFYLRTGKHLPKKVTEISIHYKKPAVCTGDVCLFPEAEVMRNVLAIRIEPDEGIALRLMAKRPGFGMKLAPVEMDFSYASAFHSDIQPAAYERLLLDCIRGDQTLFARTDAIGASWALVTSVLTGWKNGQSPVYTYPKGSWGPSEAVDLIEKDGRHWFLDEE